MLLLTLLLVKILCVKMHVSVTKCRPVFPDDPNQP
jgi:hypothetical protein